LRWCPGQTSCYSVDKNSVTDAAEQVRTIFFTLLAKQAVCSVLHAVLLWQQNRPGHFKVIRKADNMKLKLNDAIASMEYHDLVQLYEDLEQGANATKHLVKQQILEKEKEAGKHCHVCQSELDPNSTSNYTILLGPEGLRRKASFCALDCLKYFISSMEQRRAGIKQDAAQEVSDE
jgi:hypothetical protein